MPLSDSPGGGVRRLSMPLRVSSGPTPVEVLVLVAGAEGPMREMAPHLTQRELCGG